MNSEIRVDWLNVFIWLIFIPTFSFVFWYGLIYLFKTIF